MRSFTVSGLLGMLFLALHASAADPIPFHGELSHPGPSGNALTIIAEHRRSTLTLSDIETLPLYTTTLVTPFGESGEFIGVLLTDLLDHAGLGDAERLRLQALDDYTVVLTRGEIEADRPFLATRLGGEPLTLRDRGPFRLLFPTLAEQTIAGTLPTANWIWSLVEIRWVE